VSDDIRDVFIREVVGGRSFLDVGPLYGTVNEKLSVAKASGATEVAALDSDEEHWRLLADHLAGLGVDPWTRLEADVLELPADAPSFDVVHCSGVLYHLPAPLALLRVLRRLTRRHLILTSAVTATTVEGDGETLEVPESSLLFVPALAGRERRIVRDYWTRTAGGVAEGLTHDTTWDPANYDAWWWLPTRPALKALCEATGFRCEGEGSLGDNFYTLLLAAA
jgi:SAM-dependent methyltransferase